MQIRQWRPGPRAAAGLTWSGWAVFAVALLGYGWLYLASHDENEPLRLQGSWGLLAGLFIQSLLVVLVVAGHELIHLVGYRLAGGRARIRLQRDRFLTVVEPYQPSRVTRGRYLGIALAPLLILGGAAVAAVQAPTGGWWVVPAAVNVCLSVIDVATALVACRLPAGSRVQPTADGLSIELPDPDEADEVGLIGGAAGGG